MTLKGFFSRFFASEKAVGFVLIFCTVFSLILANSSLGAAYFDFWHTSIAGGTIEKWINEGLMAFFFLYIGLELEREIYTGKLSDLKKVSFPLFAALGGMIIPAGIYLLINMGKPVQSGFGIPMATDIAFAIGILSLLGKRVPVSLKVFLTALAIMDDLGAIILIAFFYSSSLKMLNLGVAFCIFGILIVFNRLKVYKPLPYLIGGVVMWYFMLHSGIHATITGVFVAFAIPFGGGGKDFPSYKLKHWMHKPVYFFILPLFALANTGITIDSNWISGLASSTSIGIFSGLVAGKPLGIVLFSLMAVRLGFSALPYGLKWGHIVGAGFLAGIGFTMSIFITLLAFDNDVLIINSKLAILIASLIAGLVGLLWLKRTLVE
jgi:Na+:H+ antiporter, NhaA family